MSGTEKNSRASPTADEDNELTSIAGSVVLSDNPPHQLKYWRKKFGIKQADLARKMNITPSVLSDYEKGRRPSPGVNFIKRYLVALYELNKDDDSHTKTTSNDNSPSDTVQGSQVAAAPFADAHINQQQ